MTSPPTVVPIGETAAEIPLPPVRAALVLNSSGGLGDGNGPDIVVNQGSLASLNPQQVGIRLKPGELFTFPLRQPSNGQQLPLYAVAAGPGGQVTVVIFPDGDDWQTTMDPNADGLAAQHFMCALSDNPAQFRKPPLSGILRHAQREWERSRGGDGDMDYLSIPF